MSSMTFRRVLFRELLQRGVRVAGNGVDLSARRYATCRPFRSQNTSTIRGHRFRIFSVNYLPRSNVRIAFNFMGLASFEQFPIRANRLSKFGIMPRIRGPIRRFSNIIRNSNIVNNRLAITTKVYPNDLCRFFPLLFLRWLLWPNYNACMKVFRFTVCPSSR